MKIQEEDHQQIIFNKQVNFTQNGKILCLDKNNADLACQNKKCINKPFVCSNSECQCMKYHQKCALIHVKSLLRMMQPKSISLKHIQSTIIDKVQQTITQLAQFRDQLIISVRNQFQVCKFSKQDQQIYEAITSGKIQKIQSKDIWNILNKDHQQIQNKILQKLQIFQNKQENKWIKVNQQIQTIFLKIHRDLQMLKEKNQKVVENKQIIELVKSKKNKDQMIKSKILAQNAIQFMDEMKNSEENYNSDQNIDQKNFKIFLMKYYGVSQNSRSSIGRIFSNYTRNSSENIKYWQRQYGIILSPNRFKWNLFINSFHIQKLFNDQVKYDHIQIMVMNRLDMDTKYFQIFAQHAFRFSNLKILVLNDNNIQNLTQNQLNKFISLEYLDLSKNPLCKKSKTQLKKYKKNNVKIKYTFY